MRVIIIGLIVAGLLFVGIVLVRQHYSANLQPVSSSSATKEIVIKPGTLAPAIAAQLYDAELIRSEPVFLWYVKSKDASDKILAGTYSLKPSMSTPEIVAIITDGKVSTDLVTILPGKRLDQIRDDLIDAGFSATSVDRAFQPRLYKNNPALVDKPASASLEGYLYPESFQKDSTTTPEDIVEGALKEMSDRLTPEIRSGFAAQGLSVYQGIVLASIVEKEVSRQDDRAQAAQVFLSRLAMDMRLESDVTAHYGAYLDGVRPSVSYSSPYNTYEIDGLPPTPISNVTSSSLLAVAKPASTDWLYFVAGENGNTYFSRTLAEHEALTAQYCGSLCEN